MSSGTEKTFFITVMDLKESVDIFRFGFLSESGKAIAAHKYYAHKHGALDPGALLSSGKNTSLNWSSFGKV